MHKSNLVLEMLNGIASMIRLQLARALVNVRLSKEMEGETWLNVVVSFIFLTFTWLLQIQKYCQLVMKHTVRIIESLELFMSDLKTHILRPHL